MDTILEQTKKELDRMLSTDSLNRFTRWDWEKEYQRWSLDQFKLLSKNLLCKEKLDKPIIDVINKYDSIIKGTYREIIEEPPIDFDEDSPIDMLPLTDKEAYILDLLKNNDIDKEDAEYLSSLTLKQARELLTKVLNPNKNWNWEEDYYKYDFQEFSQIAIKKTRSEIDEIIFYILYIYQYL